MSACLEKTNICLKERGIPKYVKYDENKIYYNKYAKNNNNKSLSCGIFFNKDVYTYYQRDHKDERLFMEGKRYLKEIKNKHSGIEMIINRMSGMPTIKGTRISISLIISCFRDKLTYNEIKEDYLLTDEQIENSLNYVIDLLDRPFMEEDND